MSLGDTVLGKLCRDVVMERLWESEIDGNVTFSEPLPH